MSIRLYRFAAAVISATLIFCSFNSLAAPRDGMHALAEKIAKAQREGQHFTEATLFSAASAPKHRDVLDEETILQPISNAVSTLFSRHPEAVSITVKTEAGKSYTLEMLRAYITGERPDMGVFDAAGRHSASYTAGLHYQGALAGDDHSLATMSIFANGEVVMLFSGEEGNFVIGKLEDNSGKYVFYNDRNLHGRPMTPCATLDPPQGITSEDGLKTGKTATPLLCHKVRVYWEVAYQLYTYKGSSLTNVQNYVTALFNQFQAMYANEKIAVELGSLYVWTTADGYPMTASDAALYAFRAYWNVLGAGFNGDIAHLLTRTTTNSLGGVAFVNALCSPGINYGFSDVSGSVQTVPTYSWDVEVVTHETGHNLGSMHTHWCGWMTGSGGSCGAIDNCYTLEATSSCSSCGSTTNYSSAPAGWQGTVMSYCHLTSRGINLANGFGPLPGGVIRSKVGSASCLNPILNISLSTTPICNNDGAVSLSFAANSFGTAPYTYSWTSGVHTQNLAGIAGPGNYTVNVVDSNGCTAVATANVGYGISSGDGIAPTVQMPVCCNNANEPLVLNAGVPQGLSACNTVYWLRSTAPLTARSDAQAYFDTTTAQNKLKSTNEGSIANGNTGASLTVTPAPCNATETWYYTPVTVQAPHLPDSFIYTATGSTSFTAYSGTQIGAYVTMPGQASLPTSCDLLDTPTAKSLIVTVTGYTGRANKMRIIVMDTNDIVLYQSPAYAGNGTYAIPAAAISGSFLQYLQIAAIDYNCVSASGGTPSCTSSQAIVSAVRKVVFGTQRPMRMVSNACTLSPSIRVDFAPAACTQLSVSSAVLIQSVSLVPNPASSAVTMKFSLQQAAQVQWKLTDMAGRTVLSGNGTYSAGAHQMQLDIHYCAGGMYFVNLSDGQSAAQRIKLVIQ